ncbi:MAG: SEC-C domain-containing protein, partial [Deltaproteobacteria bacterium]|nr:SEC-C domain-containing protein [Deltaproteobacteria bacterium]
FRAEVLKGIKARAQRIKEAYVTKESPARALFKYPERYNVKVTDIKAFGRGLRISILAMFAFRCGYLSPEKVCAIHPAVMGGGRDIRPPHCGYLGSLNAMPDGKGYCRIIHAAKFGPDEAVKAIDIEKKTSLKHYREGFSTPDEATEAVVGQVKDFCVKEAPELLQEHTPVKTPGRNDPCWCKSNIKFKKCHGR